MAEGLATCEVCARRCGGDPARSPLVALADLAAHLEDAHGLYLEWDDTPVLDRSRRRVADDG